MGSKWLKLAGLAKKICILYILSSLVNSLHPKDNLIKNIFDFTTTSDRDCVAAIECLLTLYYSVELIFLSFETITG